MYILGFNNLNNFLTIHWNLMIFNYRSSFQFNQIKQNIFRDFIKYIKENRVSLTCDLQLISNQINFE